MNDNNKTVLTVEEKDEIAARLHREAMLTPGSTHYNTARMAIEDVLAKLGCIHDDSHVEFARAVLANRAVLAKLCQPAASEAEKDAEYTRGRNDGWEAAKTTSEADPYNYKGMFEGAVSALAEIDRLLGLPEDGCNDPQVTVSALADFIAGHKDMQKSRDELLDDNYQLASEAGAGPVKLYDSQWVNIVNHAYGWADYSKEDAVHEAVRMTEQAIKANAQAAPPSAPAAEPLFWYRPRSDGGYEGPIHNDATEPLRKTFWVPLYPGASVVGQCPEGWRCSDCGSYVLEPMPVEIPAPDKWVDDAVDSAGATAEVLDGLDEGQASPAAESAEPKERQLLRRALDWMMTSKDRPNMLASQIHEALHGEPAYFTAATAAAQGNPAECDGIKVVEFHQIKPAAQGDDVWPYLNEWRKAVIALTRAPKARLAVAREDEYRAHCRLMERLGYQTEDTRIADAVALRDAVLGRKTDAQGDERAALRSRIADIVAPAAAMFERAEDFEAWWETVRDEQIHDTDPRRHAEAAWIAARSRQPSAPASARDEWAAFEEWYRSRFERRPVPFRDSDSERWEGWQGRAALAAAKPEGERNA